MLNENEVRALIKQLRDAEHEMVRLNFPGQDPVAVDAQGRQRCIDNGHRVAGDYMTRDQLDIIGQGLGIDPEYLRSMDVLDFGLLRDHWMDSGESMEKFEALKSNGNRTFEEILRDEDEDCRAKKFQERLSELAKVHGASKALMMLILGRRVERKKEKEQINPAPGILPIKPSPRF